MIEIFNRLLIYPLKLLFELVYVISERVLKSQGLSIIVLSLVVNTIALPLYQRAEVMQSDQENKENKMKPMTDHIRKCFHGDERVFILQAYYRENNYSQISTIKKLIPLILQIPFFIAAYGFLTQESLLKGLSFGIVRDLGEEDALLVFGNYRINILPFIMTGINLLSCFVYGKKQGKHSQFQMYGLALFFLCFLYHSPSGLVLYWMMNNVYSLVKNIIFRFCNYETGIKQNNQVRCKNVCIIHRQQETKREIRVKDGHIFWICSFYIILLLGVVIPSFVIAASPLEFVDIFSMESPVKYIINTIMISVGFFGIWMGVYYTLFDQKKMDLIMLIFVIVFTVDYLFFGTDHGILSSYLQYDTEFNYMLSEKLINLLILFVTTVFLVFFYKKWPRAIKIFLFSGIATLIFIGTKNISSIIKIYKTASENSDPVENGQISLPLSANGKNVIVIMLDRGMSCYVPYIFAENGLKEKYDGFTFYPNTVSFGAYTNFGLPGIMGGYEYTPDQMNRRLDRSLEEKHNEALKVMPELFSNNNYEVTICDPSYAGYQESPDLSIYRDHPEYHTYILKGRYVSTFSNNQAFDSDVIRNRNFFMYSILKVSPILFQKTIYNRGRYNDSNRQDSSRLYQSVEDVSHAQGYSPDFMGSYSTLCVLSDITQIQENGNNFLFMTNETPHEPALLEEPEYKPAYSIDNTVYDVENEDRFSLGNDILKVENIDQMRHYHINAATFIKLGEWFDFMRENGIYDNTRIIIVSDHGRGLNQMFSLGYKDEEVLDIQFLNALLMVKDFNTHGFTVSDRFMTNADVPEIAMDNIINNPINPFTGNAINSAGKEGGVRILYSDECNVAENNGMRFLPWDWFSVHENIFEMKNWSYLGYE